MNNIVCICVVLFATLMLSTTPVNSQNSQDAVTETKIDDNELGMGILFDMVNIFLGDVLHKKKISESFLNFSAVFKDGKFHSEEIDDWRDWIEYLIGFSVCAAIGILFIVAMPITGIIFCCCRLCGCCGDKSGKNPSKRAKCKRRSYCTILLILTTIALAGNVCAFICNSLIYKHLENDNNEGTVGHVKSSFQQIETFINNSANGYSDYMTNTYRNTTQDILSKVNDSATKAFEQVLKTLHVDELLANATQFSKEANETSQKLNEISKLLYQLRNESVELQDSLKQISKNISEVCSNSTSCTGFNPAEYDTQANFSSLSTLSDEAKEVSKALDMQKYIDQARLSLEEAKNGAYEKVKNIVNEAKTAINDVEKQIDNGITELQKTKSDLLSYFPDLYDKTDDVNKEVKNYNEMVFYIGIGVCCAFLLIIVLYYTGLLIGMCGEKPGDGAPCCNTGFGANILIGGVAITFIYAWILMIICVVLFCVGGPIYTEACRYFQDHNAAQIKDLDGLINRAIKLDSYYKQPPADLSLSGIIQNCQEDQALFSALQLDYIVNLNKTLDISKLQAKLEELKTSNFKFDDISIAGNLSDALKHLADSGLDKINFTNYFTELSKQVTVGNLSELAALVRSYAQKETNLTAQALLNESATSLQNLNDNALPKIKNNMYQLASALTFLEQKKTIKEIVKELIDSLNDTEGNFNSNKDTLIKEQIVKVADDILNFTSDRIAFIKQEVRGTLYKCQNLSSAVFTMSDAVCLQIVEPVNGLWFSFGWCLFFFVPCLVFAVLLAGQYRRTLEDDKEFDDPNYMMYGGPNPDTIPLTSVDRTSGSSAYPRSGMSNAGYRDENRRAAKAEPPPYDAQMHSAWHGSIPRAQLPTSYNNYSRNAY